MTEWRDKNGTGSNIYANKVAKARKVSFAPKKPTAAKRSSENAADDAWHARNKDTSGQAQANRLNAVADRLTRRAAMQRDKERIRRIRGR